MSGGDYFNWVDRHTRRRKAGPELELRRPEQEFDAAPSEPIEVQEFTGASTTVIERIRVAIVKRLRGEGL